MVAPNPPVSTPPSSPARFNLGQVVATPGALAAMERNGQSGAEFLSRHQNRDWGEVNTEDARANDESIASDGRLLSAYLLKDHTRLWVITESDRSSTCLLLPEEY
jgi:hypothetical protein